MSDMSEEARYSILTITAVTGEYPDVLTARRRTCGLQWHKDGYTVEEIRKLCGRALISDEDAKRLTGIKSRELYRKLREEK